MTGSKKKKVSILIVAVLSNSALVVGSVQSSANQTTSEKMALQSNQSQLVNEAEKGDLFEKESGFSDELGFLSDQRDFAFRIMLAILFVVILGIVAIYFSKKLLPRITGLPVKEIRVVETIYLGPRKAVHVLEIGNRRLLIGSTNESVTKLADITSGFTDLSSRDIT